MPAGFELDVSHVSSAHLSEKVKPSWNLKKGTKKDFNENFQHEKNRQIRGIFPVPARFAISLIRQIQIRQTIRQRTS